MSRNNALWNCKNPHQGNFRKVLCVCSAGLLRSPSVAYYLSTLGYNTRAAGVYDYALIKVDEVLLEWADVIVFVDKEHEKMFEGEIKDTQVAFNLNIPDSYAFRDNKLMQLIKERWEALVVPTPEIYNVT